MQCGGWRRANGECTPFARCTLGNRPTDVSWGVYFLRFLFLFFFQISLLFLFLISSVKLKVSRLAKWKNKQDSSDTRLWALFKVNQTQDVLKGERELKSSKKLSALKRLNVMPYFLLFMDQSNLVNTGCIGFQFDKRWNPSKANSHDRDHQCVLIINYYNSCKIICEGGPTVFCHIAKRFILNSIIELSISARKFQNDLIRLRCTPSYHPLQLMANLFFLHAKR